MRITRQFAEARIDTVNRMLGFDPEQVSYGTVGAVRLSGAYGGWAVERVVNECGGVTRLTDGYVTLRECSVFLAGMIAGLRVDK